MSLLIHIRIKFVFTFNFGSQAGIPRHAKESRRHFGGGKNNGHLHLSKLVSRLHCFRKPITKLVHIRLVLTQRFAFNRKHLFAFVLRLKERVCNFKWRACRWKREC